MRIIHYAILVLMCWVSPATAQKSMSNYTENVLMHVFVHEMGHALIREFDLPLLGNEEVIADEFATIYIQQALPERAEEIIGARVKSLMLENDEETIFAEHSDDKRRAGRAVCLLYGLNPRTHEEFAKSQGMTANEAASCRDSAPEIARGWRRILSPLAMPENQRVTEVRVNTGEGPWKAAIEKSSIRDWMRKTLSKFDWHSQIVLHFDHCDKGAMWSRKTRRILICDDYLERFEKQNAENSGN